MEKITKDVYLIQTTVGSNAYLINSNQPVIIDTGLPGNIDKIKNSIESIGISITDIAHIFLTHHDVDHIGNAAKLKELTNAKLWAPERDLPYIRGEKKRRGMKCFIQMVSGLTNPKVDEVYNQHQIIEGIQVIYTPGHTPGHVSFLYNDVLIAGDLVRNNGYRLTIMPFFYNWSDLEIRKSIKSLEKVKFDWVCPGHGKPIRRETNWGKLHVW